MLLLLILSMPFVICVGATDYCLLCENGSHTLCLYPKDGPGTSCLDYKRVPFAHYQKKYILDIHNDIRNHIASGEESKGKLGNQPSAANMLQMEWDEELAKIAQRWADQCTPVNAVTPHDACRRTSRYDYVGQNILTALTNGTELPELATLILNWYKQVTDVIPSDIDYFEGVKRGQFVIGQYTQLVWANTKSLGCGMSMYREAPKGYYNQRLVCNYGPGGNIVGQPVYIQGPPCSKCFKGTCDSIRKNLCESSVTKNVSPSRFGVYSYFDRASGNKSVPLCVISPDFREMHLDECKNFLENKLISSDDVADPTTEVATVYNIVTSGNTTNDSNTQEINSSSESSINYSNSATEETIKIKTTQYHNSTVDKKSNKPLKQMKNKKHIETTTNVWITAEIKYRYKRALGKWHNGECKCDQIYRSESSVPVPVTHIITICVTIIFCNT